MTDIKSSHIAHGSLEYVQLAKSVAEILEREIDAVEREQARRRARLDTLRTHIAELEAQAPHAEQSRA